MPRAGPRKVQRYSLEFKLKAVKLSQLKGVEVQAVAEALEIHPVHAVAVAQGSARRRTPRTCGRRAGGEDTAGAGDEAVPDAAAGACVAEEEHALLKKLIRFTSARKPTSSRSSKRNARAVRCDAPLSVVRGHARGVLRVAPATGECARRQDRDLLEEMRAIFERSGGTYGSPRIQRVLTGAGPRRQWPARGAVDARRMDCVLGSPVCIAARQASIGGSAGSPITCGARTRPGRTRFGWAT